MKKIICLLLMGATLLASVSMSACASNSAGNDAETTGTADAAQTTASSGDTTTTGAPNTSDDTPSNSDLSLEQIAEKIRSADYEYPSLMSMEVTDDMFEYFFGIAKSSDVKEALAVEPAMTSVPFSLCLIRVNEGSDTAALAKEIKDNVNPGKWVCVVASYVETAVNGDVIVLVMDNDNTRGQSIIDAFKAL